LKTFAFDCRNESDFDQLLISVFKIGLKEIWKCILAVWMLAT